jgi:hypothetical protein
MKLEYLPDASLLRIYDFTPFEIEHLHSLILELAANSISRIDIHSLAFVEAIDECQLSFLSQKWDQGIMKVNSTSKFEYRLMHDSWDNIAGLLEPFITDSAGFQWLENVTSEVRLALSVSGQW